MSIGAAHTMTRRMSGAEFRSFQETRPDHERWELVKGIPVMMVPPTISHQRIADNLTRLLNDALARHNPTRLAVSRSGVELGEAALVALRGVALRLLACHEGIAKIIEPIPLGRVLADCRVDLAYGVDDGRPVDD